MVDYFLCRRYDVIWAVSEWEGPVDRVVRSLSSPVDTPRHMTQRRCLILWGEELVIPSGADVKAYDVIYYRSEYERGQVLHAATHHNLQHAYGVNLPSLSSSSTTITEDGSPVSTATRLLVGAPGDACTEDSVTAIHIPVMSTPSPLPRNCTIGHPSLPIGPQDLTRLTELLRHSQEITFSTSDLREWVVVAAAVASRGRPLPTVRLTSQDDRLLDLAMTWPMDWDVGYYSRQLVAGMTRTLCLGKWAY